MKYSDRLYELAFEFKKKRLWTKIEDSEIFAIKMKDGQTGYISVMGKLGEHIALGLYIGEAGINSFLRLLNTDINELQPFEYSEFMTLQDCLQCSFENKNDMIEDDYIQAEGYAAVHGIKMTKKNGCPYFARFKPHHIPWHIKTQKEEKQLCEALEAALAFFGMLSRYRKVPGMRPLYDAPDFIPMLEKKDGEYEMSLIQAPLYRDAEYPRPRFMNDMSRARLKRLKKGGVLQCDAVYLTDPLQNEPDEQPEFPMTVFILDQKTGYNLPAKPVLGYEKEPEEALNIFVDILLSHNLYPTKIRVHNERTYMFLEDFCRKMNIKLVKEDVLEEVIELELDFMDRFDNIDDEASRSDMIDELLTVWEALPDEMPFEMLAQLRELLDEAGEILDESQAERIKALINQDGKKRNSKKNPNKKVKDKCSFVISVSLYKGCYRHIRVPASYTLEQFSSAILEAYEFDNDHAHAFYMDNRFWSNIDSYVMRGVGYGEHPYTDDYTLGNLDFYKGQQFKYIFDFGDEWRFQCKVLRVEENGGTEAEVIRSVGEAPEQYGGAW